MWFVLNYLTLQVGLSICTKIQGKNLTPRLPKREYIPEKGFLMPMQENEELEMSEQTNEL